MTGNYNYTLEVEEIINRGSNEELFMLFDNFLQYWKEQFKKEHPEQEPQFLYDYLPTDKEVMNLVIKLKKSYSK